MAFTTLAALGLKACADADLLAVAQVACMAGETIENEAMDITEEMVYAALKAVDMQGQRRDKVEIIKANGNGHKAESLEDLSNMIAAD